MNVFLGVLDLFFLLAIVVANVKDLPEMNWAQLFFFFAIVIAFLGSGLMLLL